MPTDDLVESTWQIDVWPNPFQQSLSLRWATAPASTTVEVQLFDLQGRLIARRQFAGPFTDDQQLLIWSDDGQLPDGLYLLRVRAGASVRTLKVVKG